MFTQTIPLPGVPWDAGDFFADAGAGVGAGVGAAAAAAGAAAGVGAGAGADAGAEDGEGFDGLEAGGDALRAEAGALPTVTSGVILLIVAVETPAFDKSLTDEYGRPAMIFLAVASPTPGRSLRSAALALFRSTGAPEALDELDALGFAAAGLLEDGFADAGAAADAPPAVTKGVIFLIVAADTPAFDKSLADE